MRWRTVVFDLDDTLYPERDFVLGGFHASARWAESALGIPADEGYLRLARGFDDGRRGDAFDHWLSSFGMSASHVPELVAAYRSHVPTLRPFPGIAELLAELSPRLTLGLVSDGYLEVQRAKFGALGLQHHFRAVVFSDELGRHAWKPSALPFEHALRQLECEPAAAVYVADNPVKDFAGARAAGMASIWARHSAGDYARLQPPSREHEPDFTVDTVPELCSLLHGGVQRSAEHGTVLGSTLQ